MCVLYDIKCATQPINFKMKCQSSAGKPETADAETHFCINHVEITFMLPIALRMDISPKLSSIFLEITLVLNTTRVLLSDQYVC